MPILFALIAVAYLYSQPTKYTASATFGKINNLDEGVNVFITKYIKSSEFIKKLAISDCVPSKDNTSHKIYINNINIINDDKYNFTAQLSISGKNKNDVSVCANLFFSTILEYQLSIYEDYNEKNLNLNLAEFERSLSNKFSNLSKPERIPQIKNGFHF